MIAEGVSETVSEKPRRGRPRSVVREVADGTTPAYRRGTTPPFAFSDQSTPSIDLGPVRFLDPSIGPTAARPGPRTRERTHE